MNTDLKKAISVSYRADLLDAIERATQGVLPPSAQEYCFGEIVSEKGRDTYPENGDKLLEQLRVVLSATKQITEQEYEEAELSAKGIELLWFESLDRYTFAEITRLPQGQGYDGRIYIDSCKHKGELTACANKMMDSFTHWLDQAGLQAHSIEYCEPCDHCDSRFTTLQQAVDFVYTGLCCPDKL